MIDTAVQRQPTTSVVAMPQLASVATVARLSVEFQIDVSQAVIWGN